MIRWITPQCSDADDPNQRLNLLAGSHPIVKA